MLVQKPEKRWETRPLEFWAKAKELRAKFYQDEKDAKTHQVFLIGGGDGPQQGLGPGFGNLHFVHPHPEAASIANTGDAYSRECRGATEAFGYGRNLCGYQLDYIGALLTNKHFSGSEMPTRDLVCQGNDLCAMFPKLGQLEAEFWGVPEHHTDAIGYYGDYDEERSKVIAKALSDQFLGTIEWLEKATGTEFNVEAQMENMKRRRRTQALRGEVIEMLTHIPCPLDQKSAYSVLVLGSLVGSDPVETEKLWEMIRDEMQWRVDNNIAGVANERYRWTENEPPPWFFLKYYRYMEQYGAVCIQTFYHGVRLVEQPDGSWKAPEIPLEDDEDEIEIKTKEDFARAQMGMMGMGGRRTSGWAGHGPLPQDYYQNLMNAVKAFKCDGVILPLHRAGIGCVFSMKAAAMKLMEQGIPVMHYETSHPGDRTDFDETRMLDQLDTFMELQGLRRLED